MRISAGASKVRPVAVVTILAAAFPAGAIAAPQELGSSTTRGFTQGEVLVRYEPGTSGSERADVRDEAGAELERKLIVPRMELLSVDAGDSVRSAAAALESQPDVAFAEPNFIYRLDALPPPDDPYYLSDNLWGLNNTGALGGTADADIDAPEAWASGDGATGSDAVTVAVVDGGINLGHADLTTNLWANPGESGGGLESNASDDDGNLKVDDHIGWDWVGDDNDPSDEEGHGTHVAGIIGAQGNNGEGTVGVNWDVSLMPLRACDSLGACVNSDVAEAFTYAEQQGADVVNASLSGIEISESQETAIADAPDTLFVVAAGNDANDNDTSPRYPCNYSAANLICVAASNDADGRASFSNYGAASVDLAAPGGSGTPSGAIWSTYMAERMDQRFADSLGPQWQLGGTPNTWARTVETSPLPGETLTDSPGTAYAAAADNFARFGPVDLSGDSDCQLRYGLALDIPDAGDRLQVQASSNDVAYTTIQDWTGVGHATLTPDLSPFEGSSSVYIRFRVLADGDAQTGDGAHVDDVRIRCSSTGYAYLQGTSMAAPQVSGAAALIRSESPGSSVADLREWLLDGVDLKGSLEGLVKSGGRLNLARSLSGSAGADIHRPETSIVSGPPPSSTSKSAIFSFAANEAATYRCSLNGAAYSTCTSPRTLGGLAVGTHTFRVRAVDTAGNEDATPAAYEFKVKAPTNSATCTKLRKQLRKLKQAKRAAVTDGQAAAEKRLTESLRKLRAKIRRKCSLLGL